MRKQAFAGLLASGPFTDTRSDGHRIKYTFATTMNRWRLNRNRAASKDEASVNFRPVAAVFDIGMMENTK